MDKSAALCIGINYYGSRYQLSGCINDAVNTAAYLRGVGFKSIDVVTDSARPARTSRAGLVEALTGLARRSFQENLGIVWISYSGHGTQARDGRTPTGRLANLNPAGSTAVNPSADTTWSDEQDGLDDAIVPSDFDSAGIIRDDWLRTCLAGFNPNTWVVVVMDACHSGTICDLQYLWSLPALTTAQLNNAAVKATVQNPLACRPRVLMISGCRDDQTSADAYFRDRRQYAGALTRCLLDVVSNQPSLMANVFQVLAETRKLLASRGFSQVAQLSSSFDMSSPLSSRSLFPSFVLRASLAKARASAMATWMRVMARAYASARAVMPIAAPQQQPPQALAWHDHEAQQHGLGPARVEDPVALPLPPMAVLT